MKPLLVNKPQPLDIDGEKLYFRSITAKQFIDIQERFKTADDRLAVEDFARLIAMSLCDDAGNLLMKEDEIPSLIADNSLTTILTLGNHVLTISSAQDAKKN